MFPIDFFQGEADYPMISSIVVPEEILIEDEEICISGLSWYEAVMT